MLHSPRGFTQFLIKSAIFLSIFIGITGIIGSWIIPTHLLYSHHFFIYGNIGKLIIFSTLLFILFTKDSIRSITYIPYNKKNSIFVALSLALLPFLYIILQNLLETKSFSDTIPLALTAHVLSVATIILCAVGVFGVAYITSFVKTYRKVLLACLGLSIVFYFAIFQVWKLWPYFSFIVLKSVKWLLSLSFHPVIEVPPLTLFVDNFTVAIEEACSGVDSIFLFSTLYIIIGVIDRKKLNIKKYSIILIPALCGLFLVNILRVYILILLGVFFSPELMHTLFHTYLGMLLFFLYAFLFWRFSYSRMVKK